MTPQTAITLAVLIPFIGALLIPLAHRVPNVREAVTLATAAALFLVVIQLLPAVLADEVPATGGFEVVPGLEIRLAVEPLGMMFAGIASLLWILTSIYSIGYMRGNDEKRQTSFYACFAIALGATMGVAFSANLFTLFLFYELLSLSTYPLVAHKGDGEARRAGRIYLLLLVGTSMVLMLPAIIWVAAIAGTLDFTPGGILEGRVSPTLMAVLLGLFAFGIGKAALMPFHYWLPAAMVAPTPVSALLHAVAVVKTGVFAVVKVVVYIFGIDALSAANASDWLVFFASFCLLAASVVAMTKDNLKARLAYSTVSQLAYVVLGAALVTSTAIVGAGLHIAMHAAGKITLFFCAGAIYVALHKTEISEMDGIGRRMPFTMGAFFLGAISVIGMPPLGGMWSKWLLVSGAYDAGHALVVLVLIISTVLNVGYLLPPVVRAFLLPPKDGYTGGIQEAPIACVVPLLLTATLCVMLFFLAGSIVELIGPIVRN